MTGSFTVSGTLPRKFAQNFIGRRYGARFRASPESITTDRGSEFRVWAKRRIPE
jgi:hypothetical protein